MHSSSSKTLFIIYFLCISFLFPLSYSLLRKRSRKNSKIKKIKAKSNLKATISSSTCQKIVQKGEEYITRTKLPKENENHLPELTPKSNPQNSFAKIQSSGETLHGSFKFNFEIPGTAEFNDQEKLFEFFMGKDENNVNFLPMYNWFDMKECCLANEESFRKCESMIFGFIQLRFNLMAQDVKKAYKNVIQTHTLGLSRASKIYQVCPQFLDKDLNVKTDVSISDPVKYEKDCLDGGYFLFAFPNDDAYNQNFKSSINDDYKKLAIKLYYFGSVTPTSDFDFTIISYRHSVSENYQFQAVIINNYNSYYADKFQEVGNRFKIKDFCLTTGDCFDTNAYLTGFIDQKLNEHHFTGISIVDKKISSKIVDKSLTTDSEFLFSKVKFEASASLGIMALLMYEEHFKHHDPPFTTDLESDLLENILARSYNSGPLQSLSFDNIIEASNKLPENIHFSDQIFTGIQINMFDFGKKVKEYLGKIELIMTENGEYDAKLNTFQNNKGKNVAYIKTAIKAVEVLKEIENEVVNEYDLEAATTNKEVTENRRKEFAAHFEKTYKRPIEWNDIETKMFKLEEEKIETNQILSKYSDFLLYNGAALIFANEAYYNSGGMEFQTKGKRTIFCTSLLEAMYMIVGYAVLHYFEIYDMNNVYKRGDGLLKLGKYSKRVFDGIRDSCYIAGNDEPSSVFLNFFNYYNFKLPDIKDIDTSDIGTLFSNHRIENNFPETAQDLTENFFVLNVFSEVAMDFKKKIKDNPLELYQKAIEVESEYLNGKLQGYTSLALSDQESPNKEKPLKDSSVLSEELKVKNTIGIAKTLQNLLVYMTFHLFTVLAIEEKKVNKGDEFDVRKKFKNSKKISKIMKKRNISLKRMKVMRKFK